MYIIKRDGIQQEFDAKRIYSAVYKAAKSAEYTDYDAHNIAEEVKFKVVNKLQGKNGWNVEDIQDFVEKVLMGSKYKDVAHNFVSYRSERDRIRQEKDSYAKIGIDITTGEDTESQRENSNVPRGTVTTQLEMIKRSYSRQFVRDFIVPKKFKDAHDSGDIHIHDLHDAIIKIPNCILMDYPFMFKNGFQLGNKWIETPKSILTAMNVLVQMVQVQAVLQFGGITLPDIDVHLGQFVLSSYRKYFIDALIDLSMVDNEEQAEVVLTEKLSNDIHPENSEIVRLFSRVNEIAIRKTEKETYKACKLLSYQINTLQVRGESSPFTTIGYGNSTTWEGRLIQKSILQERLDEFERSGVQEFPKHMMAIRKGVNFNQDDPNYDLFKFANKVSAKTCYPDYIFPDNQEKHTGGSAYYMG